MQLNYPKTYIVWDTETTGLDPFNDRIVEFAALIVEEGKPDKEYTAILNHGIEIPEAAANVHGITKEKCEKEGRDPKEVMAEVVELLGKYRATVTHNGLKFDVPFLVEEVKRCEALAEDRIPAFEQFVRSTVIDTAVIYKAQKLDMQREWNESFAGWGRRVMDVMAKGVKYNVSLACDELGIDKSEATLHRAGGDVALTNEIYKKLVL